jgi:hypothetical protein
VHYNTIIHVLCTDAYIHVHSTHTTGGRQHSKRGGDRLHKVMSVMSKGSQGGSMNGPSSSITSNATRSALPHSQRQRTSKMSVQRETVQVSEGRVSSSNMAVHMCAYKLQDVVAGHTCIYNPHNHLQLPSLSLLILVFGCSSRRGGYAR